MQVLGTPSAKEKKQQMQAEGDFLRLQHDMREAASTGVVRLWVRQCLIDNIMAIATTARREQELTPGAVATLCGCANFFQMGCFGRVGRAGLAAIKDRQYERGVIVHPQLEASLTLLEAVVREKPEKQAQVRQDVAERFVLASDTSLECPLAGKRTSWSCCVPARLREEVRRAMPCGVVRPLSRNSSS